MVLKNSITMQADERAIAMGLWLLIEVNVLMYVPLKADKLRLSKA